MVMTVAALTLPPDPYPKGDDADADDHDGSFALVVAVAVVLMRRFWRRCLSISSQNTSSGVASESTDSYHRFRSSAACLDCCRLFDPDPPAAPPDRFARSRVLKACLAVQGADGVSPRKGAECVTHLRIVVDAAGAGNGRKDRLGDASRRGSCRAAGGGDGP